MNSLNIFSQLMISVVIGILIVLAIYLWKITPDLFVHMTHAFCV